MFFFPFMHLFYCFFCLFFFIFTRLLPFLKMVSHMFDTAVITVSEAGLAGKRASLTPHPFTSLLCRCASAADIIIIIITSRHSAVFSLLLLLLLSCCCFKRRNCVNDKSTTVLIWGTFSHSAASFSPPVFSLSVGKQNRGFKKKKNIPCYYDCIRKRK